MKNIFTLVRILLSIFLITMGVIIELFKIVEHNFYLFSFFLAFFFFIVYLIFNDRLRNSKKAQVVSFLFLLFFDYIFLYSFGTSVVAFALANIFLMHQLRHFYQNLSFYIYFFYLFIFFTMVNIIHYLINDVFYAKIYILQLLLSSILFFIFFKIFKEKKEREFVEYF